MKARIAELRKALLVFHSPSDERVGIENASEIFTIAKHPKSFVSLAGADHLLSRRSDAAYVANVIAAWVERYLPEPQPRAQAASTSGVLVTETRQGLFQQEIRVRAHRLLADEPVEANCETKEGMLDRIDRAITLSGNLDQSQRVRLMEIADKCPVHRTLTSEIEIRTMEEQ
jgi:hypothetical protein